MKRYITLLLLLPLFILTTTSCADRGPLVEVDREVITGVDVFDIEHRGIEGSVESKYWTPYKTNQIESVEILKQTPVGATSNWFSGNALYYEIEYKVVIVHYKYEEDL